MKQAIHIIAGLWLFATAGLAQSATGILDKAAGLYNSSNGITATFATRIHAEVQNSTESFEGAIHMKGDKFVLETPDLVTWFDGTTQWSYSLHTEEVNVSTPDKEELQLMNPSILLASYKKGFDAKLTGESTAPNGKAAYDIELAPKKKSDIVKIALQVEKYSGLPARIVVENKSKISNTITISQLKTGVNQPDSFFTFDKAKYPDADIIDLR